MLVMAVPTRFLAWLWWEETNAKRTIMARKIGDGHRRDETQSSQGRCAVAIGHAAST